MAEIAIVSSKKSKLEQQAQKGDVKARTALNLAKEPSTFLSTIQVGITMIGVFTGAFGGATLSAYLAQYLRQIPLLSPVYADAISFVLIVVIITYISIILGELVPKRIAMSNPESIAKTLAFPMVWFYNITSPFVRLLAFTTDLILSLFGIKKGAYEEPVTEEEIKIMISEASIAGVIEKAEEDIINKIFKLGDHKARDIMTPQSEVDWLDADDSFKKLIATIKKANHSHFPVFKETKDNILGFVHAKDLLEKWTKDPDIPLSEMVTKPLYILESAKILKILEMFRKHNTHIAVVVDEYGSFEGIMTVNDIFESIVGEIPDEKEAGDPRVVRRDESSWLVDGILSVDEFKERFKIKHMWQENEDDYQTVGGFVMNYLGRVPEEGDKFEWDMFRFEVMDMDNNRVDKILLTRIPKKIEETKPLIKPL